MPSGPMQAEIWLADLNPRKGTEPGKVRPVVIVQSDLLNSSHPSTIVCPITTKIHKEAEILRVHLHKTNSGLAKPSDILVDHLRAVDNRRLLKRIGKLDKKTFLLLQENIKIILSLD